MCPASHLPPQLEKVYDPKNEEDDMREMEEERLRMREHVMKNVRGGPGDHGDGGGRAGRRPRSVTYPGSLGGHQPGPPRDPGGVPRIYPEEGVWGHRRGLGGEHGGILWVLAASVSPALRLRLLSGSRTLGRCLLCLWVVSVPPLGPCSPLSLGLYPPPRLALRGPLSHAWPWPPPHLLC